MSNEIGDLIKNRIKELKLPRTTIAEMAGVGESTVRYWESNGLDKAKISNVKQLANAIKVDPLILLGLVPISEHDESLILAREIKELDEKDINAVETLVGSLKKKK